MRRVEETILRAILVPTLCSKEWYLQPLLNLQQIALGHRLGWNLSDHQMFIPVQITHNAMYSC
jgi:hypothetical protein